MIRIVKMTFKEEHVADFSAHFDKIKQEILAMPGCNKLRLHQEIENPSVFFTYSDWDNDAALQNYRQSELFVNTWLKVKAWFAERAEAWSVDTIFDGPC